ncbi:hypothetical protein Hdeb2414_s1210g00991961 [Helianthus debilis subsp. tardiflorus]
MRSELASERHKPKLRDMPSEAPEEEVRVLMFDKSGETEYQEPTQSQTDTIKEISHMVG